MTSDLHLKTPRWKTTGNFTNSIMFLFHLALHISDSLNVLLLFLEVQSVLHSESVILTLFFPKQCFRLLKHSTDKAQILVLQARSTTDVDKNIYNLNIFIAMVCAYLSLLEGPLCA